MQALTLAQWKMQDESDFFLSQPVSRVVLEILKMARWHASARQAGDHYTLDHTSGLKLTH
jgi:hypothetical protein